MVLKPFFSLLWLLNAHTVSGMWNMWKESSSFKTWEESGVASQIIFFMLLLHNRLFEMKTAWCWYYMWIWKAYGTTETHYVFTPAYLVPSSSRETQMETTIHSNPLLQLLEQSVYVQEKGKKEQRATVNMGCTAEELVETNAIVKLSANKTQNFTCEVFGWQSYPEGLPGRTLSLALRYFMTVYGRIGCCMNLNLWPQML